MALPMKKKVAAMKAATKALKAKPMKAMTAMKKVIKAKAMKATPMKAMTAMKTVMKDKPMKAMKAMKTVMKAKAMKKKAMKKSVIAKGKLAKAMVLRGSKVRTVGGLKKENLKKNKQGKIVSKKASDRAKKAYVGSAIQKWTTAVQKAKKELNLKGMVPVGGKTAQGRALYAKAKAIYKA